jgi:hypothetical protein
MTPLTDLERVNDTLSERDLMIMKEDNGRYSVYRINRGAGYARCDTYTCLRGNYDSVEQALASLGERQCA